MPTENVFRSRFRFVDEMICLGTNTTIDGHHVMIRGKEALSLAPMWPSDTRADAGLMLVGLCIEEGDVTKMYDVYHADHGYPGFVETLNVLGVSVKQVN